MRFISTLLGLAVASLMGLANPASVDACPLGGYGVSIASPYVQQTIVQPVAFAVPTISVASPVVTTATVAVAAPVAVSSSFAVASPIVAVAAPVYSSFAVASPVFVGTNYGVGFGNYGVGFNHFGGVGFNRFGVGNVGFNRFGGVGVHVGFGGFRGRR